MFAFVVLIRTKDEQEINYRVGVVVGELGVVMGGMGDSVRGTVG